MKPELRLSGSVVLSIGRMTARLVLIIATRQAIVYKRTVLLVCNLTIKFVYSLQLVPPPLCEHMKQVHRCLSNSRLGIGVFPGAYIIPAFLFPFFVLFVRGFLSETYEIEMNGNSRLHKMFISFPIRNACL